MAKCWRRKSSKSKGASANRAVFVNGVIPDYVTPPEGYLFQKFPHNRIVSSKYTVWDFIPKNLFEQFRRIANFYFLVIGFISVAIDSPVSPLTTFLPLLFVVVVTGIKQGYEDLLRHRSDRKVNLKPVEIVRDGEIKVIVSQDIRVGDVIRVKEEESFPCDMVLLSSSFGDGKCYLTTANLDGETNYKVRYSSKSTRRYDEPTKLKGLKALIECERPSVNLYSFVGNMTVYSESTSSASDVSGLTFPLYLDNLLLRGARLKDTEYIYGCAVYTGHDTKLALNSILKSNKFSTVEKSMNIYLLFFMGLLALEMSLCTLQKYLFEPKLANAYYLGPENPGKPVDPENPDTIVNAREAVDVVADLFSFLVIFSYIIPISLYTTLEVQKFVTSRFFGWDADMYCPETGEPPLCNSSDLNEELGQVGYLLTDKTGTLTENTMEFRQCSVAGQKYLEMNGQLRRLNGNISECAVSEAGNVLTVEFFLLTLALCHTVTICNYHKKKSIVGSNSENSIETFEYQASSQDEKALAEACQKFSIVYCGEKDGVCEVIVNANRKSYHRLRILEFDSARKRMSVIVKFPDDTIWLLCKGAESSVFPNCIDGCLSETEQHINDYAMLGLRTLAVAARKLSLPEYEVIAQKLDEAAQALSERDKALAKVFDEIEVGLTLLGATAVEDKLQEGVQETLEVLRGAGIKIWILTGDKLETAINIAYSCGHFSRNLEVIQISDPNDAFETLRHAQNRASLRCKPQFGLVIDGRCLAVLLQNHKELLIDVSKGCEAVVCCRMSPLQKAEVVKLVKEFPGKPNTAAIGDGANDISMIQEANIGLGKEGRQAARCADFAFSRFRFLQKALLVHGQWYYWRVSTLAQYFFYKNVIFNTPMVYFSIFCAYSTQALYDGFILTMFNVTITGLPIFVFGVLDQNYKKDQLLSNLHLYRTIAGNTKMGLGHFLKWNLFALWHATVIYFGTHLFFYLFCDMFKDGKPLDYATFGTIMCHVVSWIANLKLLLEARYWTWLYVGSVILSMVGGYSLVLYIYCAYDYPLLESSTMLWIYMVTTGSLSAWLLHFLLVAICLLPEFLITMAETRDIKGGVVDREMQAVKVWRKMKYLKESLLPTKKARYFINTEF